MGKLEISIYCQDEEYGKALSKYITVTEPAFAVNLLGSEQEAREQIVAGSPVLSDVGFSGRYFWVTAGEIDGADACEGANTGGQSCIRLYKYWSARRITDELCFTLKDWKQGERTVHKSNGVKAQLIGIVGCGGGSGNTVITVAIARALTMRGKNVICLSMEDIDSFAVYTGGCIDAPPRTLGDYIYSVMADRITGNDNRTISGDRGFTYADAFQVRYFYIDEGENPFKLLDMQEAEKIVLHMTCMPDFDYIIVDVGGSITESVHCVLERCGKIMLTSSDAPSSQYKAYQMKQILAKEIADAGSLHMAEVRSRCRRGWQNYKDAGGDSDSQKFYIEEDAESFMNVRGKMDVSGKSGGHRGAKTEILSNTGFQLSIQEIVRWIEEI